MAQCPRCGRNLTQNQPHSCPSLRNVSTDPFLGRLLDKDFYIRSPLGEGGFAKVYLADQRSVKRRAVVKILKPHLAENQEIVERFYDESLLARRLEHHGIAQIFRNGKTKEGIPFFAMEYVAGRPLSKIIRAEGALEFKRVARILALIAEAIDAAHEGGVIHRDLKPDNIMIIPRTQLPGEPEGSHEGIKILDFGIAKRIGAEGLDLNKKGEVLGTPFYMSPEQCSGEAVTYASDLYSLGVITFEMFTGKVPFTGPDPDTILLQHVTMPPPHLEEISDKHFPAALEGLISRALAKHPEQRHRSAREFAVVVAHSVEARISISLPEELRNPNRLSGLYFPENTSNQDEFEDPYAQYDEEENPRFKRLAIGFGIFFVFLLLLLYLISGQKGPENNMILLEPDPSSKPSINREKTLRKSTPSPGAELPEGADLANVPPLPAKRMGILKPKPNLMIPIKKGFFPMGENPGVSVFVGKFSIDAHEVTNQEYHRCVEKRKCRKAKKYLGFRSPQQPVVGVSWEDAYLYCRWAKKRLPTEAEWEKAARGSSQNLYPWGNEIDCDRANYGGSTKSVACREKNPARTAMIASYPDGASPYGVYDMAGNVAEWVSDAYLKNYLPQEGSKNPTGPTFRGQQANLHVVRGGGWRDEAEGVTAVRREGLSPSSRLPDVGFRCVIEK